MGGSVESSSNSCEACSPFSTDFKFFSIRRTTSHSLKHWEGRGERGGEGRGGARGEERGREDKGGGGEGG